MGGHKFQRPWNGNPALRCPRMSPKLYIELRDKIITDLRVYFTHVVVSTEAPEKPDHGDVDILVCGPRGHFSQMESLQDMEHELAAALQATRSVYWQGILFTARPIPPELLDDERFLVAGDPSETWPLQTHPQPHIQIDLVLCDASSQLEWCSFRQAHGDLSNILQTGLHDAGFTFKPSGLHIRIPEIEAVQKRDGSIFLSNDVDDMLLFFGMDPAKYKERFATLEELFSWIATCKYLTRRQLVLHSTDANQSTVSAAEHQATHRKLESYFEYMEDRAMYARFADVFLASHPDLGVELSKPPKDILSDALQHFGAHHRYIVKLANFEADQREAFFWDKVSKLIPTLLGDATSKNKKTRISEGLKRFVRFDNTMGYAKRPVLQEEPQMIKALQPRWTEACDEGGLTEDELLTWIGLHWEQVYNLERLRDQPRRHLQRERKDIRTAGRWRKVAVRYSLTILEVGLGYWLFDWLTEW